MAMAGGRAGAGNTPAVARVQGRQSIVDGGGKAGTARRWMPGTPHDGEDKRRLERDVCRLEEERSIDKAGRC